MKTITKILLALSLSTLLASALSSCHTAQGISQDLSAGTRALGETFDTGK